MFDPTTPPRTLHVNRRTFLQATAVAGLGSMLNGQFNSLAAKAGPSATTLKPTGSHVASLAMPTPMLVINGTKDGLFDLDGVETSFAKLNSCYTKAGVPEHCHTRFYETPHEFNAEMQAEAWAWLKRWV